MFNESLSHCSLYSDYYIEKINNVCITNNDIQSHLERNNDYADDENNLRYYEASDNDKTSFSEIVDKINNDVDIYSISGTKNYNLLNLTPNPLNKEELSSLDITFEANIDPMQLQKSQLFLNTSETCVRKINKTCDHTQVYEKRKK